MDPQHPDVRGFFDPATWTITYVVHAGPGSACAIVDPVLDYDPKSGRTRTHSADQVAAYVRERELQVAWILETHAHADHLTAAPYPVLRNPAAMPLIEMWIPRRTSSSALPAR